MYVCVSYVYVFMIKITNQKEIRAQCRCTSAQHVFVFRSLFIIYSFFPFRLY